MTVFPVITSTLSAKELGAFVQGKYPLHGDFDCKLFRTGMNHTYFLSNNETKYVLRVYSHNWRSKPEISEEITLLKLLQENNLSVSFPIPDRKGEYIQEIEAPEGKRYVVLFSFAKGEKIRFLKEETCFNIGALMAKIHTLTENKILNRISYNYKSLLEEPYTYLKTYFTEDLPEMEFIKNIDSYYHDNDFENLQKGSVHLDIWYDNMAVKETGDITIFDFDFCGNGPQILDVGYFCFQLFNIETDKTTYEQKKKQFLAGYQSVKRISDAEMNFIPKAGLAVLVFYLGVQAKRFDWSNIFLSENYLKMFYIGRLKSWITYNNIEKTIVV
ncbi:phosphotransferase [Algibacter amylolyticus]|uniref:Phosphotransferase n=1 Tax=Algibacter amylolyticus TaxID=1608400 RepID=A0A5M7BDN4_9FLAO|nr:phosphotransferase [Algibacter amylolyticus]KAA5826357.1 phosphotransferase [Algibacter amylolyticus]MBB5268562.1 Ser/Thr protein kinase RdoA (MazF antagonist) [Algibacter amylolyticus]TSJ80395.1 phosphotransferase [Algibacter amylolyticus]